MTAKCLMMKPETETERCANRKARRTDLAMVQAIPPVGDKVDGHLAFWRLDSRVGLSGWDKVTLA